ncbi:MAG TPA: hypothetical protein PK163_10920, partial [Steroidobacteraceae bacterium]|nr:hypothetical protein [Steroidobacteraceae bacterium]
TSATATSANGGNQPITVRPELGRIRNSAGTYYRVVYFGTGRFLGLSDLNTTAPSSAVAQAIYAVKDTGSDIGVFPTSGTLVAQTLNTAVSPRTIPSPVAVDWSAKNGWYITLPVGERVNVDPRLQLGTLVVLSNYPDDNYCTIDGTSLLYALDYTSGTAIKSDMAVGFPVGNALANAVTLVLLPTGKLVAIIPLSDATVSNEETPHKPGAGIGVKRIGWRELN